MSDLKPVEMGVDERVGVIRHLARDVSANLVRIGSHLAAARKVLGAGTWGRWVEANFSWTVPAAMGLVRVAERFAGVLPAAVERVDATALLILSAPTAPPEARRAALESAAAGTRVTPAAARGLIAAARGTPARAVARTPTQRPEAAERPAVEDHTPQVMAWAAVELLVEKYAVVRLERVEDSDEDDPTARPWAVHLYAADGAVTTEVSKDGLASAVTLAAGTQPTRTCACGQTFPVFEGFSRKAGNPLGRSTSCRRCETRRVGDGKKRKRGTFSEQEVMKANPQPDPRPGREPGEWPSRGTPATPPGGGRTPPAGEPPRPDRD